jgi:hypothetical protein
MLRYYVTLFLWTLVLVLRPHLALIALICLDLEDTSQRKRAC